MSGRCRATALISESVCDTRELVCIRAQTDVSERTDGNIPLEFVFTGGIEAEGSRQNHGTYVGEVNVRENKSRMCVWVCVCVQMSL